MSLRRSLSLAALALLAVLGLGIVLEHLALNPFVGRSEEQTDAQKSKAAQQRWLAKMHQTSPPGSETIQAAEKRQDAEDRLEIEASRRAWAKRRVEARPARDPQSVKSSVKKTQALQRQPPGPEGSGG